MKDIYALAVPKFQDYWLDVFYETNNAHIEYPLNIPCKIWKIPLKT